MKFRSGLVGLMVVAATLAACSDKTNETASDPKADYDTAIKELVDPIAKLSVYQPYLEEPEGDKYTPKRRPDLQKGQFFVCEGARHAANAARQRGEASKSPVTRALTDSFSAVSEACAEPTSDDDITKCAGAIKTLDKALEPHVAKAKTAGAAKAFPRIASESVNDTARTEIKSFQRAMGPGEQEKKYLQMRSDASVSADTLISTCQAAKAEAETSALEVAKVSEAIRKLSVIHKYAIETQCNRLNVTDATHKNLEICAKNKNTPECKEACGKAKAALNLGVPAAAFEKFKTDFAETCEDSK